MPCIIIHPLFLEIRKHMFKIHEIINKLTPCLQLYHASMPSAETAPISDISILKYALAL